MKSSPLGILALSLATAFAGPNASDFLLPVDSGPELAGGVSVISSASGNWKDLDRKLVQTEDGFQGTLTAPDGKEIHIESHYKKAGAKWECSIKWQSDSETPSAFILAHYVFPADQIKSATMISGKAEISFEKMIEKIPTRNNFAGVSEFTLGPIEGATLHFTLPEQSLVEAVLIGENIHVRTFLTPTNESLPANGSVEWMVEKQ